MSELEQLDLIAEIIRKAVIVGSPKAAENAIARVREIVEAMTAGSP